DHHRFRTAAARFLDADLVEPDVGVAAFEAELPNTPFRAPIGDALGGLRRQLVRHIPEKQQVGLFHPFPLRLSSAESIVTERIGKYRAACAPSLGMSA